jgi:glycosyltransferase involved in cell wall biosynthesis
MARGVQNKLLEALAMGLPCVASTAAFRGTELAEGEGIFTSDDPAEFARRVVQLLQDSTSRAEMARRARAAAEVNYRWEAQLSGLDAVIAAVVSRPYMAASPLS